MGTNPDVPEDYATLTEDFFHLARLALLGRKQDVQLHIRRVARRCRGTDPELASRMSELLRNTPGRSSPIRGANGSAPVLPFDTDSRLELLRFEPVVALDAEPIYNDLVEERLGQIVKERSQSSLLEARGLTPTRSALFVGPPGVGKTLAARWIARELDLPLLLLDLSAVMSSFLGRTGSNVRQVLDYAKKTNCVLLIDELDAIAKRRDDATEIGELKRLVTVLLQEIDDWTSDGLLISATNHAELLDPAVWRRFDVTVDFPMPGDTAVGSAVDEFFRGDECIEDRWRAALSIALRGSSFSDVERTVMRIRRAAALNADSTRELFANEVRRVLDLLTRKERADVAKLLSGLEGFSQRFVHELTGVSREKIRKDAKGS